MLKFTKTLNMCIWCIEKFNHDQPVLAYLFGEALIFLKCFNLFECQEPGLQIPFKLIFLGCKPI